jgi:iron complex transport system substrate-binding protein
VAFRPRGAALRFAALMAALVAALIDFPVVSATPPIDDRGVAIELRSRPARIIALSPHLAELAYAAGAGSQLAAVVRYSDYPDAARALPQVGDGSRIDIERVIAIKPDLILGWRSGNPPADLQRLEDLGFTVFITEPTRLADIARLTRTIGALAGTQAAADAAADAFERELESLRARYSTRAEVPVFYEIWHRPLLTINGAHLISDVIALCGGRNVFAAAPVLTPAVSLEAVVAARPRVVLGGSSATRPEAFAAAWREMPVESLRRLPVRYVPPDLIQRQTLRIAHGARVVCEHLEALRRSGDIR